MATLRLLADDLTGALDTAAEFVGLTGPVHAFWQSVPPEALPANAALDLGTRESDGDTARAATLAAARSLVGAGIAFKKVDSLIRGHTLAELATCFSVGGWDRCVLAPAFPFQGRVTRGGQQFAASGDGWSAVGPNLVAALQGMGLPARAGHSRQNSASALLEPSPAGGRGRGEGGPTAPTWPDDAPPFYGRRHPHLAPLPPAGEGDADVATDGRGLLPGITVFDAENDADLDAIVAQAGGAGAPVLWCGTGGLARALAGDRAAAPPALPHPILGLFGSDQAVTAAQLAACDPHWLALPDGSARSAAALARGLDRHGIALATHALPPGVARDDAAQRIDRVFRALVGQMPAPGTLAVAGGETLRGLCLAFGAASLEVQGRAVPGVPVSILRGGRWDGVTVVSKSGAFGHPTLLRELLRISEPERIAL